MHSSDGGSLHLQANMLLLLLLCFLSSAVSWLEVSRLFSSLSSLVVCCVTSGSSSLGSGLGVSGSGVWKLQSAEAEWLTLWLMQKQTTVDRTRKRTGIIYFHSIPCSTHLALNLQFHSWTRVSRSVSRVGFLSNVNSLSKLWITFPTRLVSIIDFTSSNVRFKKKTAFH